MKEKDFVQMVVSKRQGFAFLSYMRQHLVHEDVRNFESTSKKSKLEFEAMPRYVDSFFKSRFEDGDDLFKSMKSLKQAKDMGSYPKLAEIHETTMKSLESKVRNEMQKVQTAVSKSEF
jgi:hypothetical protein